MNCITSFFQKPIFTDKRFVIAVWFLVPLISGLKHAFGGVFNDYLIFKNVFYNTIDQVNLYLEYPEIHADSNHYGPIFSLIFAPFALLPDSVGTIQWELAITATLFIAIYKLPIEWKPKVIIYYILLQCSYANSVNSETNTLIAALVIGSFIFIRSEKDFWAACFITLGLFIKLYGIVGLAFFFFSKNKIKLIAYMFLWSAIFFVLPMIISSPQFIVQSYADWYDSLVIKNALNIASVNQDISVMGMVRRISGVYDIPNVIFLAFGLVLFGLQYLKINLYDNLTYQLGILASTLLFVILFSTGSESCTYIIATSGVAIWFVSQQKMTNKYAIYLLIFVLVMRLISSGVAPDWIRKDIVRAYALLALPYLIVWLTLVYQLLTLKKDDSTDVLR